MNTILVGIHLNNFLGSSMDYVFVLRVCKACHTATEFSSCHTILFIAESRQSSAEHWRVDGILRPSVTIHWGIWLWKKTGYPNMYSFFSHISQGSIVCPDGQEYPEKPQCKEAIEIGTGTRETSLHWSGPFIPEVSTWEVLVDMSTVFPKEAPCPSLC